MGLFLFLGGYVMVTRHTLGEARGLLSDAQQYGNVFNLVYSGLTYWLDRYTDAKTSWYHGIKHYLLDWMDEAFDDSTDNYGLVHSPEMATAIGELVERMLN